MTIRKHALRLAIVVSALWCGSASAASFNCRQQLPSDMRTICNDRQLNAKDDQTGDLYDRVNARMDATGRATLKAQRLGFVRARGACRGDRRCMNSAYDDQIAALRSMLRARQGGGMKMVN